MSRKNVWLKLPVFVVALALVVSWWRENERKTERATGLMGTRPQPPEPSASAYPYAVSRGPAAEAVPAEPEPAFEPAPPAEAAKVDDLKRIEGVGPKIESVLKAAGIVSFAQVAGTTPGRLEEVLTGAGIPLANPATWPEQAALAAADDWQGLELLQSQLKGGRRVV